MLLLDIKNIYI